MAKAPEVKDFQRPTVVFQPRTRQGLQRGINLLAEAIRPTLGPLPRVVAVERIAGRDRIPELLDSGGTIARRTIQVEGRNSDVGAMFLRHVLWELQEKVGDGTASAAVMFQSIFNQGLQHIVNSGGNAMRMRVYFDRCVPLLLAELDRMTVHLHGKEQFAHLAETIAYDPPLAKMMGEIFDIIGEYGRLEIRQGRTRDLEREYVEGIHWDGGWFSRDMMNNPDLQRAELEDASILISDLEINEPIELLPVLNLAVGNNIKNLVIMSVTMTDRAMSILNVNKDKITVVGVKSPEMTLQRRTAALQDLAILTGGQALYAAAGDTLSKVKLEQLGRARRMWANREFFGVIGGRGDPRLLRRHIADLRRTYQAASEKEDRSGLLSRIGKLMGGSATLWVGDMSPTAIEQRKELATRTAEAMRGAMREGVLPGGGAALLDCRKVIQPLLAEAGDPDEIAAYRILIKALEAPARAIWQNAGFNDVEVMVDLRGAMPGTGFDVVRRRQTNMAEAGIWDSASVVKAVVHSAIAGAALALTTDVLVHRKRPPESMDTA
jgi:chaperonin GroEL